MFILFFVILDFGGRGEEKGKKEKGKEIVLSETGTQTIDSCQWSYNNYEWRLIHSPLTKI